MIISFECYLQRIQHISITQTLTLNIASKTFKRFVHDSYARYKTREKSWQVLSILNCQGSSIQYTTELGHENKLLSFFYVTISNTGNSSYDLTIFRKTWIANIQIKPKSNIALHITISQWEHSRFSFTSI